MNDMDCTGFRQQLGPSLDGELAPIAAAEHAAHATACDACGRVLAAEQELRSQLKDLSVPPMRATFPSEAFRRVREIHGVQVPDRRRDILVGLSGAAAAASCIAVALLALRAPGTGTESSPSTIAGAAYETVSLSPGDVEAVRLRIEAPRDLTNVRFSIELPDQVWLADQPGLRAIAWDGSLRKGENILELPLVAQAGATGTMTARVSWGDFQKRLQTRLVTVPSPAPVASGAAGGT